jgi:hypothetical protein
MDPIALGSFSAPSTQAWESLAGEVGTNPLAIEAARLKLANVILGLSDEAKDPDELKNAALRIMRATMLPKAGQGGASTS